MEYKKDPEGFNKKQLQPFAPHEESCYTTSALIHPPKPATQSKPPEQLVSVSCGSNYFRKFQSNRRCKRFNSSSSPDYRGSSIYQPHAHIFLLEPPDPLPLGTRAGLFNYVLSWTRLSWWLIYRRLIINSNLNIWVYWKTLYIFLK